MTFDANKYKFKIICNRCGSDQVAIEQCEPPYWDDGYIMNCDHCGARGIDDDELIEKDWIKT